MAAPDTQMSVYKNGVPPPCPRQFNLAQYVLSAARADPDKTALEVLGENGVETKLTYAALRQQVLATAHVLKSYGVSVGSYVVLRIGNDVSFPITFLAACAIGAIPVPTARMLTQSEFGSVCAQIPKIDVVVTDDDELSHPARLDLPDVRRSPSPQVKSFANTNADDPAYLIFTSGSAGTPKGVMHAHRAVWARRMMWNDWYGLRADDRLLHSGAFNWTYTLGTGLLDPWAIGATSLVFSGVADRHTWPRLIAKHAPTLFATAPGVVRQIVEADSGDLKSNMSSLRHVLCAGDTLNDATRHRFERATSRNVLSALGMSEVSTYVSSAPHAPTRAGYSGRPQAGRHIAVIGDDERPVCIGEEGVLAVHRTDPGLMLGYVHTQTGHLLPLTGDWFLTGDRATMDADGWISYRGRNDDLINAGGYRLSPVEVEAVLSAFPSLDACAVAAVDVREGVSVIGAFYVGSQVDEDALSAFASDRLARYKQPRVYMRVPALPTRANGKLARKELPDIWKNR